MTSKNQFHRFVLYRGAAAPESMHRNPPRTLAESMAQGAVEQDTKQETENPSPKVIKLKLFQHCLKQLDQAIRAGDTRPEWQIFIDHFEKALDQLSENRNIEAMESLFLMGQLAGQLSDSTPDVKTEMARATLSDMKRRRNLIERNNNKAACKASIQEIARQEWANDSSESIRITEMAEIVWAQAIQTEFEKDLPNSATGLKEWIKPVAPKYASKRGRPKK